MLLGRSSRAKFPGEEFFGRPLNYTNDMEIKDFSKNIEAVIFDMDGTMINNMPYHQKAWKEFCRRKGLELSSEEFKEKISGKKNNQIFEILFKRKLSPEEETELTEEKEQLYRDIYSSDIKEVTGLSQLIHKFKTMGIKLAVATTAPKKNRDFGLKKLNLSDFFNLILGDEHVENGKPDPEIYLLTAKELNVEPRNCLVFEDTPVGVESAKRAGMKVVGISTTHSSKELQEADLLITDFTEFQL
jgi:beta-phosphoglucomutase family hydrolase